MEVSSVHGVPGALGALSIAFCGSAGRGLFFGGGGRLIWVQLVGIVVTIVWSSLWTFVIMKVVTRIPVFLEIPSMKYSLQHREDSE